MAKSLRKTGSRSRIMTASMILASIIITCSETSQAKAFTGWMEQDVRLSKLTSGKANRLRSVGESLARQITKKASARALKLKEVIDLARNAGHIQGMVTNGNTIGFTTDEYKTSKSVSEYRMLVTVPMSEEDLERIKEKLPNGQEILASDKVYYHIAGIKV